LFHPDRMASRILGMGDVVTLVEMAKEAIDEDEAKQMAQKVGKTGMDFNDLLQQFRMIKKMGSLESIMKLIPGFSAMPDLNIDDKQFKRIEAIIYSMTPEERKKVNIINGSRKKRIAKGSGTTVNDVNKLIMQLEQMNKMLKKFKNKFGGMNKLDKKMLKNMFPPMR